MDNNIPPKPPFIPRVSSPGERPPNAGKEVPKGIGTIDASGLIFEKYIDIRYSQYWLLLGAAEASCGATCTQTYITRRGTTISNASEIASSLGVNIDGLSATLSSKLQKTVSVTLETQESHMVSKGAPECGGVTLTSWQLVDKYTITTTEERAFGFVSTDEKILEVRMPIYHDDVMTYPLETCCPNKVGMMIDRLKVIPPKAYLVNFPGAAVIMFGGNTSDGKVHLAQAKGEYSLRDFVPHILIDHEVATLIPLYKESPELTNGVLSEYTGSMERMLLSDDIIANNNLERRIVEFLNKMDGTTLSNFIGQVPNLDGIVGQVMVSREKLGGNFSSLNQLANTIDPAQANMIIPIILNVVNSIYIKNLIRD